MMLKRLQRLVRSWYGAVVDRVVGPEAPPETQRPPAPPEAPPAESPDARFEQLESRRLVEEIRADLTSGPKANTPGRAAGASAAPVEKTIGPAPAQPVAPTAAPTAAKVEKTIGPAPGGTSA